jgi:aryl-alcohol dehydrogenase-like predicted oxidoreductase
MGTLRFLAAGDEAVHAEQRRAFDAALDAGVDVIHTSDQYPAFAALGEFVRRHPRRDRLHHIVKVHEPDYDDAGFDPARLRSEIERLLRSLGTDHLAVVQHLQRGPSCPPSEAYREAGDLRRIPAMLGVNEALAELVAELRSEGKVGALATFPHTLPFADAVLDSGVFDAFVHFLNPLEPEMVGYLDRLAQRGMSLIAMRPVLQGLLTDRRADRAALAPDDPKRDERWDPWYELLALVTEELGGRPASWEDFALQFALAPAQVTTVVIGLNTVAQVERAVEAAAGPRPERAVLERVDAVVAAFGRRPKDTIA